MVTTYGFISGQAVRGVIMVAAVVLGLAIGYAWATQGRIFDISEPVAVLVRLASALPPAG